jgi:GNAT superfamily N-acetyltransferase
MTDDLEIWFGRPNPDIVRGVARMFELADDPKDTELLNWQYLQHLGGPYLAIAHDGSGPVDGGGAMYAAFPTRFRVGGFTHTVVQSFDTLTLPAYRGKGLFVRLADVVYEGAAADGVAGVYGFPNDASVKGFTKHLSWTMMDPLPMMARPVGLRYPRVRLGVREPMVSGPSASSGSPTVPDDIDELFDEIAGPGYVGLQRDRRYLDWRLGRPGANYRVHTATGQDGRLEALGICELTVKHGCALGYVMELMHRPGSRSAGRRVGREMVAELRNRGADMVLAWALPGGDARRALTSVGFVPLPERVRPVQLHFGARALSGAIAPEMTERGRWNLSYLDSDTV